MSLRKTICIITAAAIFFAAAPQSFAGSFGSSPPFFNADHLVPGSSYSETIYLVQDQPVSDLNIQAQLNVPDSIKSWFTIDKGFNFVIPSGTRQFPVVVTVTIPAGTGLGEYNGSLVFTTTPNQSGQVTIALGVSVAINLTVGNDIYEKYSVPLITFSPIEEGWNPQVVVKFENDGNVPESFDSATFDLYDQYDATRLDYITVQSGLPTTPPFTTDQYTVEFPTDFHLGVGQYWGVVTFYKNQQAVASQKTIFNVLPRGAILGFWGSMFYSAEHSGWLTPAIIALIVIILLFVIWMWRRKSSRRRSHA